ncbi:hypothetical protein N310_10591, partial [Acanthisitta chloris]
SVTPSSSQFIPVTPSIFQSLLVPPNPSQYGSVTSQFPPSSLPVHPSPSQFPPSPSQSLPVWINDLPVRPSYSQYIPVHPSPSQSPQY